MPEAAVYTWRLFARSPYGEKNHGRRHKRSLDLITQARGPEASQKERAPSGGGGGGGDGRPEDLPPDNVSSRASTNGPCPRPGVSPRRSETISSTAPVSAGPDGAVLPTFPPLSETNACSVIVAKEGGGAWTRSRLSDLPTDQCRDLDLRTLREAPGGLFLSCRHQKRAAGELPATPDEAQTAENGGARRSQRQSPRPRQWQRQPGRVPGWAEGAHGGETELVEWVEDAREGEMTSRS
ncbi:hypothetical protein LX36DRAFT_654091 [Colletotrichum falcatum]|nr:hypothetical protein LX36DRAFT_654091 [Colletotrichum falcatum]